MKLWLEEREEYLREEMASEGRRGVSRCCGWKDTTQVASGGVDRVQCAEKGTYRCIDCDGSGLYCDDCIQEAHLFSPLHRLQVSMLLFFRCIQYTC